MAHDCYPTQYLQKSQWRLDRWPRSKRKNRTRLAFFAAACGLLVCLKQAEGGYVGKPFSFLAKDAVSRKPLNLRSMRGQYILVYFCGRPYELQNQETTDSWGPNDRNRRKSKKDQWRAVLSADAPLRRTYTRFHSAGFEIVQVFFQSDLKMVRRYAKETQLPWLTVSDLHGSITNRFTSGDEWDSAPALYLIDKSGRCVLEARQALHGCMIGSLSETTGPVAPRSTSALGNMCFWLDQILDRLIDEKNFTTKTLGTADRLKSDAKEFKEVERRTTGAGSGLKMFTLAQAIKLVERRGIRTSCYTTHLNETKLKSKYGKPDEKVDSVEILVAANRKMKCRGLRYDWLIVYVTNEGEIVAVDKYPF